MGYHSNWKVNNTNIFNKEKSAGNSLVGVSQAVWDASKRSQSDLHWETELLETSQKRLIFCDVFKTSQKHLRKHVFVWRLWDVLRLSQKRCLFRDVSETSEKHLLQVFVIFQKYSTKMTSCYFRRIIMISDKIDVGPLNTKRFLGAVHRYQSSLSWVSVSW